MIARQARSGGWPDRHRLFSHKSSHKSVNGFTVASPLVQVGMFTVREDFQHSGSQSIVTSTVTARLSRRIQLTGSANESHGRWSSSYGGQFTRNLATVSVSHSIQFLPLRGFAQVLSASISLQLPHSASINASTVTLPTGQIKYSVYGGSYMQGPLAGSAQAAVLHHESAGKYVLAVRVLDAAGQPVEGATLAIGTEEVTTDSTGSAWLRAKKDRMQPLRVALEDFVAVGNWAIVSCPDSVSPETVVEVRVRRKTK